MANIGSLHSGQVNSLIGQRGTADLLSKLGDRVSQALAEPNKPEVNPQEIIKQIAAISSQPIAGANHSFVV